MANKAGLTPGGYRNIDAIFSVASSQRVHRVSGGHEIREKATNHLVRAIGAERTFSANPKVKRAIKPGAAADGWQAYVDWNNTTGVPISLFQSTWTVPPPPLFVGDQTVFLFPGIENISGNVGILQPVLQWGVSHIGGGPYWTVASWYVPTSGEAFFSNQLVRVNPGDVLTGGMRMVKQGPAASGAVGAFSYDCSFTGVAGTDLAVDSLPELTWANLTLEAYGVASRDQYPATAATIYGNIALYAGPGLVEIPWAPVLVNGAFGESATVIDGSVGHGRVEINY